MKQRERASAALLVIMLVGIVAAVSLLRADNVMSGRNRDEQTKAAQVLTPDVGSEAEIHEDQPPRGNDETNSEIDAPTDSDEALSGGDDGAIPAGSYFALDADSGDELLSSDADREVAIASTVKIATALVVLQHADLDELVAIEQEDLVDPMVQSNMGLVAGDTLSVKQLLTGLLIPSGSDAANALARYVGASLSGESDPDVAISAFVDAMNAYVDDLGLQHTHFANPAGDDDPDSYSSARDMALLGAELMKNDTLAGIVGQASYSFTSEGIGQLYEGYTTNQLLGTDGVIGIKTGSTEDAGGCVILARESANGDLQIVSVLGADLAYEENIIVRDARWDDARQLLAILDAR